MPIPPTPCPSLQAADATAPDPPANDPAPAAPEPAPEPAPPLCVKRGRAAEPAEPEPAPAKRGKEDEEDENKEVPVVVEPEAPAPAPSSSDNDNRPAAPPPPTTTILRGEDCPYLDTINRAALDFDFEAACSVTLSPVNVYACLVCGRFFRGRGPSTPACAHALDAGHAVFMRLADGAAFVLPDGVGVDDPCLDAVRAVLDPRYTPADIAALDTTPAWARALDGTPFAPGLVGVNNLKATDYAAVAVQALARVSPLRDFFLVPANYAHTRSPLVHRFGALLRKLWNPRAFKGHVSPHEFMQAVLAASGGRFGTDARADTAAFLVWLLNTLHTHLTVPPAPGAPSGAAAARLAAARDSVVSRCFRGELEVATEQPNGAPPATDRRPFFVLALDLPPAPLYKDALEKNIIPQVPVADLLQRYNGSRADAAAKGGRRTMRLLRTPPYLVLHVKRFTRNAFFGEKNPTIVTFPVKGLDVASIVTLPPTEALNARYDLAANIVHEGPAGGGSYRAHVQRKSEGVWYDAADLAIAETLPQVVALSEAYVQVYERVPPKEGGNGGVAAMQE